jgi:hypothetical protein
VTLLGGGGGACSSEILVPIHQAHYETVTTNFPISRLYTSSMLLLLVVGNQKANVGVWNGINYSPTFSKTPLICCIDERDIPTDRGSVVILHIYFRSFRKERKLNVSRTLNFSSFQIHQS